MKKITVLLADDHIVVRKGLRALLNRADDIEVVGEAENGVEAIEVAKSTTPEVVVMDVAMPRLNGCEATRRILKEVPSAKVLVLSLYSDEESIRRMVQAGAAGYLTKQAAAKDLLHAVRELHRGNEFFSPEIPKSVRERSHESCTPGQPAGDAGEPTGREAEVMQLIAESYANKQIAFELCLSIKTVEKHRQSVMNKLNLHEAAGLTRYAIAKGMVEQGVRATI